MGSASPWLTTQAAARYASCSLTTILRAIRRGELKAHALNRGRIYRIHTTWVDAWLGLAIGTSGNDLPSLRAIPTEKARAR